MAYRFGPASRMAAGAALAFASIAFPSHGQTTLDPAQQIQGLAPQLVAFTGSPANFRNLATGLVQGTPVVLSTITSDGIGQTVTLAAQAPMAPAEAARALEAARQQLIARGIANPTAQQLGTALVGGPLQTALGTFQIPGSVTGGINAAALTVQQQAAAPFGGSAENFRRLNAGLTRGGPITLNATTSTGAVQSLTFSVPGAPLSPLEASQAIQLANQLLAQQGIFNPTPEQIRAALLGGSVNTGTNSVALRGVLQDRGTVSTAPSPIGTSFSGAVNTSNSPVGVSTSASRTADTSASPVVGTSNSPTATTSASPAANTSASPVFGTSSAAGASTGAPSPAAQMQGRR
jgi:hypothetical protein